LIINATMNSTDQLDTLIAAGLKPERLIAWTGNVAATARSSGKPSPRAGSKASSEPMARAPKALDYKYWDDGDGSEYNTLAAAGLPILVTGYSDKTSRQLSQEIRAAAGCGFDPSREFAVRLLRCSKPPGSCARRTAHHSARFSVIYALCATVRVTIQCPACASGAATRMRQYFARRKASRLGNWAGCELFAAGHAKGNAHNLASVKLG